MKCIEYAPRPCVHSRHLKSIVPRAGVGPLALGTCTHSVTMGFPVLPATTVSPTVVEVETAPVDVGLGPRGCPRGPGYRGGCGTIHLILHFLKTTDRIANSITAFSRNALVNILRPFPYSKSNLSFFSETRSLADSRGCPAAPIEAASFHVSTPRKHGTSHVRVPTERGAAARLRPVREAVRSVYFHHLLRAHSITNILSSDTSVVEPQMFLESLRAVSPFSFPLLHNERSICRFE